MNERETTQHCLTETAEPSRGQGLPRHIQQLVNPDVLRQRREKMRQDQSDAGRVSDRRRRYIVTIVEHHLYEELKKSA